MRQRTHSRLYENRIILTARRDAAIIYLSDAIESHIEQFQNDSFRAIVPISGRAIGMIVFSRFFFRINRYILSLACARRYLYIFNLYKYHRVYTKTHKLCVSFNCPLKIGITGLNDKRDKNDGVQDRVTFWGRFDKIWEPLSYGYTRSPTRAHIHARRFITYLHHARDM